MRRFRLTLILLVAASGISGSAQGAERIATPRLKNTSDSCLHVGQSFSLRGSDLGSSRQYDLELLVGRNKLKPAIKIWRQNSITFLIPRKPELSGQQGTLALRNRTNRQVIGNKLSIRFCASEKTQPAMRRLKPPPTGNPGSGQLAIIQNDGTPPTTRHEPQQYEAREVLVVSRDMAAARRLDTRVRELGFSIKRRRSLNRLGMVISVLRPPEGIDVGKALRQLQHVDRKLKLDANHRYRLSADADAVNTTHRLVKWGATTPGCGKGIRLGMIDTAIETNHPSLRKAQIVSQSFLPLGMSSADSRHATAIASILVGQNGSGPKGQRIVTRRCSV